MNLRCKTRRTIKSTYNGISRGIAPFALHADYKVDCKFPKARVGGGWLSQSYHKTKPESHRRNNGHVRFVSICTPSLSSLPFPFHSLPFHFFFPFSGFKIPDRRNSLWPQHGRWQQLSRDTNYKRAGEAAVELALVRSFFQRATPRNSRRDESASVCRGKKKKKREKDKKITKKKKKKKEKPRFSPGCRYIGLLNGPCKVYERSGSRSTKNFFEDARLLSLFFFFVVVVVPRRSGGKNLLSFSSRVNSRSA